MPSFTGTPRTETTIYRVVHQVSEQPSEPFPADEAVVHDRVRRRLAGVLRQLDRRIAELEAERRRVEQLEAELAGARAEAAALRAEGDGLREEAAAAHSQYEQLLATKTFRLLAGARRAYALALQARRPPRD